VRRSEIGEEGDVLIIDKKVVKKRRDTRQDLEAQVYSEECS
jgi:hypothetical protein